jgi:hypothetical protein
MITFNGTRLYSENKKVIISNRLLVLCHVNVSGKLKIAFYPIHMRYK